MPLGTSRHPFGRTTVAMVTPFTADASAVDLAGAAALAAHLVDQQGCDGIVVGGTTGEAPTTSDDERDAVLRAVLDAVGDRAVITAGVSSNDTRHAVDLARAAERAGAHGLLVVTPYYSRPTQEGVAHHFRAVADRTGLPVCLYDIPARTGTAIATDTLLALAEHPRIAGVKDVSYDLAGSSRVIAATDLRYYSGADELNLPLCAVGAVGVVSTVAHVAGQQVRGLLDAFERGDNATATALHHRLLPLVSAMALAPGVVTAKALLTAAGQPAGPVRPPLLPATPDVVEALAKAVAAL